MKRHIIIAPDIFAKTEYLSMLVNSFLMQGNSVDVIYPYNNKKEVSITKELATKTTIAKKEINEQQAYEQFIIKCGHDKYAQKLKQAIEEANKSNCNDEIILLGFSAGAFAIWKAIDTYIHIETNTNKTGSNIEEQNKVKHFIGFYPSQIRNNLELVPYCPTTLIFPKQEDHFDVDILIEKLINKKTVTSLKVEALHGFMNPISKNYCKINSEIFNKTLIQMKLLCSKNDFVKAIKILNLS